MGPIAINFKELKERAVRLKQYEDVPKDLLKNDVAGDFEVVRDTFKTYYAIPDQYEQLQDVFDAFGKGSSKVGTVGAYFRGCSSDVPIYPIGCSMSCADGAKNIRNENGNSDFCEHRVFHFYFDRKGEKVLSEVTSGQESETAVVYLYEGVGKDIVTKMIKNSGVEYVQFISYHEDEHNNDIYSPMSKGFEPIGVQESYDEELLKKSIVEKKDYKVKSGAESKQEDEQDFNWTMFWIIVIVIVLVIFLAAGFYMYKNKDKMV
jgi:hypothetical protein